MRRGLGAVHGRRGSVFVWAFVVIVVVFGCDRVRGIEFGRPFTDHAVLQTDTEQGNLISVWGTSAPHASVTLSLHRKNEYTKRSTETYDVEADGDGAWHVTVDPDPLMTFPAAPFAMVACESGTEECVRLEDIVIGEVLLCVGDAEMRRPIKSTPDMRHAKLLEHVLHFQYEVRLFFEDTEEECDTTGVSGGAEAHVESRLRDFKGIDQAQALKVEAKRVRKRSSSDLFRYYNPPTSATDGDKKVCGKWLKPSPRTLLEASAMCYFTAVELLERHMSGRPVGLVMMTTEGETPIEPWTPKEANVADVCREAMEPEFQLRAVDAASATSLLFSDLRPNEGEENGKSGRSSESSSPSPSPSSPMFGNGVEADALQLEPYLEVGNVTGKKGARVVETVPHESALIACTEDARHEAGRLYEAKVKPWVGFSLRAMMWSQGIYNARLDTSEPLYACLLRSLIYSFRRMWGIGDFSFILLQLPTLTPDVCPESTDSIHPCNATAIRIAQNNVLPSSGVTTSTGMVRVLDLGHLHNNEGGRDGWKLIGKRAADQILYVQFAHQPPAVDVLAPEPEFACWWDGEAAFEASSIEVWGALSMGARKFLSATSTLSKEERAIPHLPVTSSFSQNVEGSFAKSHGVVAMYFRANGPGTQFVGVPGCTDCCGQAHDIIQLAPTPRGPWVNTTVSLEVFPRAVHPVLEEILAPLDVHQRRAVMEHADSRTPKPHKSAGLTSRNADLIRGKAHDDAREVVRVLARPWKDPSDLLRPGMSDEDGEAGRFQSYEFVRFNTQRAPECVLVNDDGIPSLPFVLPLHHECRAQELAAAVSHHRTHIRAFPSKASRISASLSATGNVNGSEGTQNSTNLHGDEDSDMLLSGKELQDLLDSIALTPPRGANSWNAQHTSVSAPSVIEYAQKMVELGLVDAGYRVFTIDDAWSASRDVDGQIVPDPVRFPKGMLPVAQSLEKLGMQLGLYTASSSRTCQNRPGSMGFEEEDARYFCDSHVRYVKNDECSHLHGVNYRNKTWTSWRKFQKGFEACTGRTGRTIVSSVEYCKSISGCGEYIRRVAHLWRTYDDLQPNAASIFHAADVNNAMWPLTQPGAINDPDMLTLGLPGLSHDEEVAHFALWAFMSAPLLISTDLNRLRSSTLSILLSPEILALNEDPLMVQGSRMGVRAENGTEIWVKPLSDGTVAVLLLNRGEAAAEISVPFADVVRYATWKMLIAQHTRPHVRVFVDLEGDWVTPSAVPQKGRDRGSQDYDATDTGDDFDDASKGHDAPEAHPDDMPGWSVLERGPSSAALRRLLHRGDSHLYMAADFQPMSLTFADAQILRAASNLEWPANRGEPLQRHDQTVPSLLGPGAARWTHFLTAEDAAKRVVVRDLIARETLGEYEGNFTAIVPRHGARAIRIALLQPLFLR